MLLKIGFIALIAGLAGLLFLLLERGVHNPQANRGGAPTQCTPDQGDCSMLASVHLGSADKFFATLASSR